MLKKSLLVGVVLITHTVAHATSGGGDKSLPPSKLYNSESFKKDLDILVPLATKLKGKCLTENDVMACKKSDAIVNVLRELASKNSGEKTLSEEEQKRLIEVSVDILRTGILETIQTTNAIK